MGIRIDPLNLSESHYVGEWFNFAQFKDSICRNDQTPFACDFSIADDDRDDSTHADE